MSANENAVAGYQATTASNNTGRFEVKKKLSLVGAAEEIEEYPLPIEQEEFFEQDKKNSKGLESFEHLRITKEKYIAPNPPSMLLGEAQIAAPGNITAVTAEGKNGKTATRSAMIAGAISKTGVVDGFEGLHVVPNKEEKAVIGIDTEQSAADQQYNLIQVLKRNGFNETPPYYLEYNIRTENINTYKQLTIDIVESANQRFNGVHMIFIDGGADYIPSVNDEPSANEIVSFFIWLAVTYNCAVILIIHLNENAGKNGDTMPRGHLGRQAVRKGYCQLNITKDGDVSTLQALRARKASSVDTPTICFKYDKDKGYHISVDPGTVAAKKQSDKESANMRNAEAIAKKVFAPPAALRNKDAIAKIMKATSKAFSTAKRYLNDYEGWGFVVKGDDGCYRLADGI